MPASEVARSPVPSLLSTRMSTREAPGAMPVDSGAALTVRPAAIEATSVPWPYGSSNDSGGPG